MNISEIVQALNNISIAESNFEFENFFLETFPTKSRQLVAVMAEIEKLYSQHLNLTESFKSQVMYDKNRHIGQMFWEEKQHSKFYQTNILAKKPWTP